MKRKAFTSAVFIPVALLIGFVMTGYLTLTWRLAHPPATQTLARLAPPLNLPLWTPNGVEKRFDLKSMRGERVLVNFFASWCVPCLAELPVLRRAAQQNVLAIVGVAYNDNYDAVMQFLGKYGNVYARVVLDATGQAAIDWGIRGVPESFLIDEKGNLIAYYPGPLDDEIWAEYFAPYFQPMPVLP